MSDPARKLEKAQRRQEQLDRYSAAVAEAARHGVQFVEFPKIPRLNRPIVITEKIDGTNAAIHVGMGKVTALVDPFTGEPIGEHAETGPVVAQSRSRLITVEEDNYGFARWVKDNEQALLEVLGPGTHFGEWWGQGIQRGYRQTRKWFSLFNYTRWSNDPSVAALATIGVQVIPILYRGPWMAVVGGPTSSVPSDLGPLRFAPDLALENLALRGSVAATVSGVTYKKDTETGDKGPEGVVVFHEAGRLLFKATIENDEQPKSFLQVEHEKWLDEIAKEPL